MDFSIIIGSAVGMTFFGVLIYFIFLSDYRPKDYTYIFSVLSLLVVTYSQQWDILTGIISSVITFILLTIIFRALNQQKKDEAGENFDQAEKLILEGKFAEALSLLDRAIELMPNYTSAYINKGICLRKLSRNHEATSAYLEAIKLDPQNVMAYNNLAVNFMDLKKYQAAFDNFKKAFSLGYSDLDSFISAAICGFKSNRKDAAIKLLDEIIEGKCREESLGLLYFTKAIILQRSGNDGEAKKSLTRMNNYQRISEIDKQKIIDLIDSPDH